MGALLQQKPLPAWAEHIRFACPNCRSPLSLDDEPVRCDACGFEARRQQGVYSFIVRDHASDDDWRDTYDKLALGSGGNTSAAVQYRSPLQQRRVVSAFSALGADICDNAKILDVGCGNGTFWENMFPGRPIMGVDFSLGMCALAQQRGLAAFQADALALPFADEQFDLIYCAGLLEHIPNLSDLCRELARICRPGGRIIVGSANRHSILRQALRLMRTVRPHPVDSQNSPIYLRTGGEISAAIHTLPLSIERVCWTHFPFPWLRCSQSSDSILSPLATNLVVRLIKRSTA